ncbi:MAG: DUF1232 domain-containing protein [Thermomicrobiales bacterium]|nr:DUF1232 domain-containing protein [Thermomicrobiales bacterium]
MARSTPGLFTGAGLLLNAGLWDQVRLSWRLLRDERVGTMKYLLPALVALYFASPIDAIPDFFVGLGQVDDLGLVVVAVLLLARLLPRLAPGHVVDEHLRAMGMAPLTGPYAGGQPGTIDADFSVRG